MSCWSVSREKKPSVRKDYKHLLNVCLNKMPRNQPEDFIPTTSRGSGWAEALNCSGSQGSWASCIHTHIPVCSPHLSAPCFSYWTISDMGDGSLPVYVS